MNSVNDLITAIINREFDCDEIDADIEFVNKRFYMIQNYFDAVYKHTYGSSVASTLVHKKYITTEQYQDYIMELDSKRTVCHDAVIAACAQINRMCDQYGLQHLCPEVKYDEKDNSKCINRGEIGDFVGKYMHEVFRQGREGRMMEPIVPEDQ